MFDIKFTPRGQKDLEKLTKDLQSRIIRKLQFFALQDDPLIFSKPLVNLPPSTRRFRVGDYRIAFFIEQDTIYIDRIGHRREVYYLEINLTGER